MKMCRFILRGKHAQNLGGFIVERVANFPFRDIVVGNPYNEPVLIKVPVYNEEDIEFLKKLGLIVRFVYETDSLLDVINEVRREIEKRLAEEGGQQKNEA